jgi:DNA-binding SARP family transcriptional activator
MTLVIEALGPLRIHADRIALRKVSKKGSALLVYLAMQDGAPVPREKLADLLWSYQAPEQARHSLRNCLLEVRKAAGSSIITDFTSCRVIAESDVRQFAALAASDDRHDLQKALYLYRGALLEDFDIASEPWEEWCQTERDGLREIAIHVAHRLVRLARANGEHDQAILAGKRAVQLDNLNEDSHRALMRAYAGANKRFAVVRQYNTCEALMRDELGVWPTDQTRAIRDAICKHMAPPMAPLPLSVQPETSDELRRIAGEFAMALEGRTKLAPALVRQSVVAMIDAADALTRKPETGGQPDLVQPIAA